MILASVSARDVHSVNMTYMKVLRCFLNAVVKLYQILERRYLEKYRA